MLSWFKKKLTLNKTQMMFLGGMITSLSLVAVVVASNIMTENQNSINSDDKELGNLIKKIESLPEYALRIKEDNDSPLRILEAKVKETSKEDFQKLTNKNTEKNIVVSVPEATFLNTSDKKITKIVFMIRDLSENKTKGLVLRGLSIKPGENYTLSREQFTPKETVKMIDETGNFREITKAAQQSEKFWLPFSDKTQIRVSVAVSFDDGTQWMNKDTEGESK